jgi:hypothetical protein
MGWEFLFFLCLYFHCYSSTGAHPGEGWTGALFGLLDGLWSIRFTLHYLHFTHTHSLLQPQWWRFFWDALVVLVRFRTYVWALGCFDCLYLPFLPSHLRNTRDDWGSGSRHYCTWSLVCLMGEGDTQLLTAAYLECNYLMGWDGWLSTTI